MDGLLALVSVSTSAGTKNTGKCPYIHVSIFVLDYNYSIFLIKIIIQFSA
uniref:Uncharacterized protein n=1 Tax=Rhizophora mucronata TaxID=61149 RepID=A0A2P2PYZ0_RHIMU